MMAILAEQVAKVSLTTLSASGPFPLARGRCLTNKVSSDWNNGPHCSPSDMKLYIIITGWIYSNRKPWHAVTHLKRMTNATMVSFVDNPDLNTAWYQMVNPDLTIRMSTSEMHSKIRRVIPWIHERPDNMYFLPDEQCCHAPYLLYRRFEAMRRLPPVEAKDAQILVLRPDSMFDPHLMLNQLNHGFRVISHTPAFTAFYDPPHHCPRSINDQWLYGPYADVKRILLAFENLTTWHKEWERDPNFVRWWTVGNVLPSGKFFLNTEGVLGKILQATGQRCRMETHVDVQNVKT